VTIFVFIITETLYFTENKTIQYLSFVLDECNSYALMNLLIGLVRVPSLSSLLTLKNDLPSTYYCSSYWRKSLLSCIMWVLQHPISQYLGSIRMGNYLTHIPVICYLSWIIYGDTRLALTTGDYWWLVLLVTPIAIVVSALLQQFIQNPIDKYFK
jgi:hypothetical protein